MARISAIDELVAKLNGASPSVCELYTEKVGELEKRKRSKLEAAEYRYTSSKDSIETGFNSTISSYNRSEKVPILSHVYILDGTGNPDVAAFFRIQKGETSSDPPL